MKDVLHLPSWRTIQQYRQSTSSTTPVCMDNLSNMMQEMERRGCKGIGGIHWDEILIRKGIMLCKRTGQLIGFEDLGIPGYS